MKHYFSQVVVKSRNLYQKSELSLNVYQIETLVEPKF